MGVHTHSTRSSTTAKAIEVYDRATVARQLRQRGIVDAIKRKDGEGRLAVRLSLIPGLIASLWATALLVGAW